MGAQKDQAPHLPMVVTNRGDRGWRGQGKRYPSKERRRTQWGGYGKQYGTGGEGKSNKTYKADRTQTQGRNTTYESQRQGSYFPTKALGMDKVEMGEMKIEMIKGNIGILELVLKMIVMKRVIQRILVSLR